MRAALERHGILDAYRLTEGTIHRCELRRSLHRMLTVVCVCVCVLPLPPIGSCWTPTVTTLVDLIPKPQIINVRHRNPLFLRNLRRGRKSNNGRIYTNKRFEMSESEEEWQRRFLKKATMGELVRDSAWFGPHA